MQISVNTDLFKSIKWDTGNEEDLKKKLTYFSYQLGIWCSAVNQVLANPSPLSSLIAQELNPPWTPFTCVITPGAGSGVTSTSNSSYLVIGKTAFINGNVTITAIGTASGAQFASMPIAPKRTITWVCRENNVNGLQFSFALGAGSTTAQIVTNANGNPTWALSNYAFSVVYETA